MMKDTPQARYRLRNAEKVKMWKRAWMKKNRDKARRWEIAWRAANPESVARMARKCLDGKQGMVNARRAKSCRVCESRHRLDLHHVDPTTKMFNLSSAPSRSAIAEEAAKCVTLCRSCHMKVENRIRGGSHPLTALYLVAGIA